MLNAQTIATSLFGLVGWHPVAPNTGPLELPESLEESRSGLYVNDLHELLRLDVLADAKPAAETLANFLARLTKDALLNLVGSVVQAQGLTGKVLLSDAPLLAGPGRAGDTVNKLGRFVGIRLKLADKRGVAYSLPAFSIQLDTVLSADLPIYVYSDASPDPVAVATVLAGSNRANYPHRFVLEGADAVDLTFAAGRGTYAYIGYYEDDLPLGTRAVQREFSGGPCGCVNDPRDKWKDYVTARSFSVPVGDEPAAPDAAAVTLDSSSFGLDLEFYAYCNVAGLLSDKTGKVNDNQQRLAGVVQMAIGLRLLQALRDSPNLTQLTQREAVQADATAGVYTLQAKLYGGKDLGTDSDFYPSALKNLQLELSGMDAACLPQVKDRLSVGSLAR